MSEKAEYLSFILYFEVFIILLSPKLVIGEELFLKNITPPPHDSRQFFYLIN
jgi:hypothetical protein